MRPAASACCCCAWVAGQLPAYRLYEDAVFVVLLDCQPRRAPRALIVNRAHSLLTAPDHAHLLRLTGSVVAALSVAGYGHDGVQLHLHDAASASAPHAYLELLPELHPGIRGWRQRLRLWLQPQRQLALCAAQVRHVLVQEPPHV